MNEYEMARNRQTVTAGMTSGMMIRESICYGNAKQMNAGPTNTSCSIHSADFRRFNVGSPLIRAFSIHFLGALATIAPIVTSILVTTEYTKNR